MAFGPAATFAPGVSAQVLAVAFREVAALLNAGVPINMALAQAAHYGPWHFRHALEDLAYCAEQGEPISQRMRAYRNIFNPIVPAMVSASEQSGNYAWAFELLAGYFEAELQLVRTIQQAMIYPGCVLFTAAGAAAVLAFLGFMSRSMAQGLGFAIVAIIALWLVLRLRTAQQASRYVVMLIPFFGGVMQQLAIARFCQTFGLLIRAGVPYLEGLEAVEPVVQHPLVVRAVRFIYAGVRNGNTVEDSIRGQAIFPPVVHNLVGSGEVAGSLDISLIKAAEYLQDEAEYKIKNSAKFVGPVLIIVMAIIVLLILMGFMHGYFNMLWGILEE
jgi:type II secretory pathway component PulF